MNNLLSIFGGGLWIIPVLLLGATIFFGYKWKKGEDSSYAFASLLCAAALISTVWAMIAAR